MKKTILAFLLLTVAAFAQPFRALQLNSAGGILATGTTSSMSLLSGDSLTLNSGSFVDFRNGAITFSSGQIPLAAVSGAGAGTITSLTFTTATALGISVQAVNPSGPAMTITLSGTSQVPNLVYASRDGVTGVPLFRSLVLGDLPSGIVTGLTISGSTGLTAAVTTSTSLPQITLTLSDNLTGWNGSSSASFLTTAAAASDYQPLDAALTALAAGSDFVQFTGPLTSTKVFTLPNATATILTSNAAVTLAQGGLGRDLSAVAKGGLFSGTGSGALGILAVGTDGQVLVADAASTGGIKWAAGGGTVTSVNLTRAGGLLGGVSLTTSAAAITISSPIFLGITGSSSPAASIASFSALVGSTITFPATGTVGLLGTANVWTAANTITGSGGVNTVISGASISSVFPNGSGNIPYFPYVVTNSSAGNNSYMETHLVNDAGYMAVMGIGSSGVPGYGIANTAYFGGTGGTLISNYAGTVMTLSASSVTIASGHVLKVMNTTAATSTLAGALILTGGVAVGGGVFSTTVSTGAMTSSATILSTAATSGVGYGTGAGGAVTQGTDRSTAVTLNTVTGLITTATNSLAAQAAATFVVTNSAVVATDTVILAKKGGFTNTTTDVRTSVIGTGTFSITVHNLDSVISGTAEVGVGLIRFTVIKSTSN